MPSLCLSVAFLDSTFHGRGDGSAPEWPPSPLRLFQSLVAVAAARSRGELPGAEFAALRWLESLPPPVIIAPQTQTGQAYRLSVPNNAMDIVGRAWSRGNTFGSGDADPRTHRAMKTVQPTRLTVGDTVHYVWTVPDDPSNEMLGHLETLSVLASQLVSLGWGIDLVAGRGRVIPAAMGGEFAGETWSPVDAGANRLRLPVSGTLDALTSRHAEFLSRCDRGNFTPVPPLRVDRFAVSGYRRETDAAMRPVAAFQLLEPKEANGFRAFDLRRSCTVAAMLRHATKLAAEDARRPSDWIAQFVLGHGEAASAEQHEPVGRKRFAYLPLPSLEGRGKDKSRVVGSVRRALVTVSEDGFGAEIAWARRALSGRDLVRDGDGKLEALLSLLPGSDRMVLSYTRRSTCWSTVTPVILPGHDDRNPKKAEMLLRKAIRQAGFSEVLAKHASLEWRSVGFRPGVELAREYFVPEHLRSYPRQHVRIEWRDADGKSIEIPGPICVGGGRYQGLGLFAAD